MIPNSSMSGSNASFSDRCKEDRKHTGTMSESTDLIG